MFTTPGALRAPTPHVLQASYFRTRLRPHPPILWIRRVAGTPAYPISVQPHHPLDGGAGNTLVVRRLDRLGRPLSHLLQMATNLEDHGIDFRSVTESVDTTTAGGKQVFSI